MSFWSERSRSLVLAGLLSALAAGVALSQPTRSRDLPEPPVLVSSHGVLDLLMIARAAPITTFAPYTPTGWVYDVCKRPADGGNACPPSNANLYGGTRLQLQAGDTLKIHLVNQLPFVLDSEHALEPGHGYLALNPTNIHTHGMLVAPRYPSVARPTYGDNVFVMTLNPANGALPPDSMVHGDVKVGSTDYEIKIPGMHPSGLFWFHPHVHGIALNQVSAGLAGIITVGKITDYVCKDAPCAEFVRSLRVRHIILKDTQILASSRLLDDQDAGFCTPQRASGEPRRQGSCPGVDSGGEGGGNNVGGRWFFTLNGEPYPNIKVGAGGELWRITTASGSVSYDLVMNLPSEKRNMIVQVLAIDGVAVRVPRSTPHASIVSLGGAKIQTTACPSDVPGAGTGTDLPICASHLMLMPSSRVEIWVAYRDASGALASPPPGTSAVWKTVGRQTGPDGDSWPQIDLATVGFAAAAPTGAPQTLAVADDARRLADPQAIAQAMAPDNAAAKRTADCVPLPAGHYRRIFFNVPTGNPDAFGLGYEEVDQRGKPVPGSLIDVHPFDPDKPTICVLLGPGNTPVHEHWELVNLAGEDHNFHIHQVKFGVVGHDTITGDKLPVTGVLHDNVPLPHADGTCASVAAWRHGACVAHPVTVDIPFAIAGDFVYHCHILEHEDGGMMARIRVRSNR